MFPFAFLEAFGNKSTTIKKLKSKRSSTNKSDLDGLLQRNNIHLKVCTEGEVTDTLTALRESPATTKHKAKFNDEVLGRIYGGRRFKNDTERLEKLFDLYTKMTA